MSQEDNAVRVFVYGTLKQGNGNHRALRGAEFLGRCSIKGNFTLIDMGWYPGVVRGGSEQEIFGEVYKVSDEMLATMDLIEGHPNFYERIKVWTPWKNSWVYTLGAEYLKDAEVIPGGVWRPSEQEQKFVDESKSNRV